MRIVLSGAGDGGDILQWSQRMLPEYFSEASAPFHADLFANLRDCRRRLMARVAPRGHAKSTCLALAYPLWCICEKQRRNIVIISNASPLAVQFVRDIRQELESNERILAQYGDLCSNTPPSQAAPKPGPAARKSGPARTKEKTGQLQTEEGCNSAADEWALTGVRRRRTWSAAQFTTNTGITVQAKGSGASFRGVRVGPHRPDLIICDDLEKDEHVRTEEGRRKLEQWLRKVVLPALHPSGRLIVLGSLIHYDSLLAAISNPDRFHGWDYRVYRAIECERIDDVTYRRVALWPARWPLERLDEEKQRIGTVAFEQEYQANPIDESRAIFRPEWLRRYTAGDLVGKDMVNLIAVDPATGTEEGDFFAMWVGSLVRAEGKVYTRVLWLKKIGFVEQVKRVLEAAEEWQPVRIGIETTAYQVSLLQMLEDQSRQLGLFLPLVPIKPCTSKKLRVESSCLHYENGTMLLPADLDSDLEAQFLQFPRGKNDDGPDVCAMGLELARSLRTGIRFEARLPERGEDDRRRSW